MFFSWVEGSHVVDVLEQMWKHLGIGEQDANRLGHPLKVALHSSSLGLMCLACSEVVVDHLV